MIPVTRGGRRSDGERLRGRVVFAGSLLVFLLIGIVLVGDFALQWWLLVLPVALLVGPLLAVRRANDRDPGNGQDPKPWE